MAKQSDYPPRLRLIDLLVVFTGAIIATPFFGYFSDHKGKRLDIGVMPLAASGIGFWILIYIVLPTVRRRKK